VATDDHREDHHEKEERERETVTRDLLIPTTSNSTGRSIVNSIVRPIAAGERGGEAGQDVFTGEVGVRWIRPLMHVVVTIVICLLRNNSKLVLHSNSIPLIRHLRMFFDWNTFLITF